MRLWHHKLIPLLDRQRLLGQHRECCALRGMGWGKKHSTVNYVFKHSYFLLYHYHKQIIKEMKTRGYKPNPIWLYPHYRGKTIQFDYDKYFNEEWSELCNSLFIYPEHNAEYLIECKNLLLQKQPNYYKEKLCKI